MTLAAGLSPFVVSYLLLWGLVLFQAAALIGLVRMVARGGQGAVAAPSNMRGRSAPDFVATDLAGVEISSTDLKGEPAGLLFVSPECASCDVTLDELTAVTAKTDGRLVVVCEGSSAACAGVAAEHDLELQMIADTDGELSRLFEVRTVPTAVLVDPEWTIRSYGHPLRGEELIQILLEPESGETSAVAAA